jgi:hypothetical protein
MHSVKRETLFLFLLILLALCNGSNITLAMHDALLDMDISSSEYTFELFDDGMKLNITLCTNISDVSDADLITISWNMPVALAYCIDNGTVLDDGLWSYIFDIACLLDFHLVYDAACPNQQDYDFCIASIGNPLFAIEQAENYAYKFAIMLPIISLAYFGVFPVVTDLYLLGSTGIGMLLYYEPILAPGMKDLFDFYFTERGFPAQTEVSGDHVHIYINGFYPMLRMQCYCLNCLWQTLPESQDQIIIRHKYYAPHRFMAGAPASDCTKIVRAGLLAAGRIISSISESTDSTYITLSVTTTNPLICPSNESFYITPYFSMTTRYCIAAMTYISTKQCVYRLSKACLSQYGSMCVTNCSNSTMNATCTGFNSTNSMYSCSSYTAAPDAACYDIANLQYLMLTAKINAQVVNVTRPVGICSGGCNTTFEFLTSDACLSAQSALITLMDYNDYPAISPICDNNFLSTYIPNMDVVPYVNHCADMFCPIDLINNPSSNMNATTTMGPVPIPTTVPPTTANFSVVTSRPLTVVPVTSGPTTQTRTQPPTTQTRTAAPTTQTVTQTQTRMVTQTQSVTATVTVTATETMTATDTATQTMTESVTETATDTGTETATETVSETMTEVGITTVLSSTSNPATTFIPTNIDIYIFLTIGLCVLIVSILFSFIFVSIFTFRPSASRLKRPKRPIDNFIPASEPQEISRRKQVSV